MERYFVRHRFLARKSSGPADRLRAFGGEYQVVERATGRIISRWDLEGQAAAAAARLNANQDPTQ